MRLKLRHLMTDPMPLMNGAGQGSGRRGRGRVGWRSYQPHSTGSSREAWARTGCHGRWAKGGVGKEEEEDAQTCNPLPSRTHACTQSETGISLWMGILKSEADFLIRHHHHRHLRCGSLMPEVRRLGPYE